MPPPVEYVPLDRPRQWRHGIYRHGAGGYYPCCRCDAPEIMVAAAIRGPDGEVAVVRVDDGSLKVCVFCADCAQYAQEACEETVAAQAGGSLPEEAPQ